MTRQRDCGQSSIFAFVEPLPPCTNGCVSPWAVQIKDGIAPTARFIESVRRSGVIEPIITATVGGDEIAWVVSGRRRVAAARIVGLKQVDEKRYRLNDWLQFNRLTLELQYMRTANPIAEFGAAMRMLDAGASVEDICECTGLVPGQVKRLMRLSQVQPDLRQAVIDDRLNMSSALACVPLANELQQQVCDMVRTGVKVTKPMIRALVDQQRAQALAAVAQHAQNGFGLPISDPSRPVSLDELANRLSTPTLTAVLSEIADDPQFASASSLFSACLMKRSRQIRM